MISAYDFIDKLKAQKIGHETAIVFERPALEQFFTLRRELCDAIYFGSNVNFGICS